MAGGTFWKGDLTQDSTISLWVAGAVMNMARLPKIWSVFMLEWVYVLSEWSISATAEKHPKIHKNKLAIALWFQ